MNNKFTKGFEALSKNSSKYLGFMLNSKGAFAKLDNDDKSLVQNAYICIQNGKTPTIWEIENGATKSIPASLYLWFKNHKKLGPRMMNPTFSLVMKRRHFHRIA